MTAAIWSTPPHPPALAAHEIHVWKASVAEHMPHEPALRVLLDAGELERCTRFHFAIDRARHAVSRGLLRMLVGQHLGRPPAVLRFEIGPYGKPQLAGGDEDGLAFNLSHSGDLVLIALARTGRLGVDVENWRPRIDGDALHRIAETAFSPTERGVLRQLSPALQRAAFFAIWSRKEAYIKATGLGVSQGLTQFEVSWENGAAQLLADSSRVANVEDWTLYDLEPGPQYSGALAIDARNLKVIKLNAVPGLFDLSS